jgi:Semialdehyde dehydrogenase, dimerisation domain
LSGSKLMSPTKGLRHSSPKMTPTRRPGYAQARGVTVLEDPAADLHPTWLEAAGSEGMFVGRLRADLADPHAVLFWSVADSLRTGAAPNTIQIAVFPLRGIPGLTRQLTLQRIGRLSRPGRSA